MCDKGLQAEISVRNYLLKNNCEILDHRLKTPFAEVDLLVRSAKGNLVIVEVKTLSNWDWIQTRLARSQRTRLKRAALYLENKSGEVVLIWIAFVSSHHQISWFEIDPE